MKHTDHAWPSADPAFPPAEHLLSGLDEDAARPDDDGLLQRLSRFAGRGLNRLADLARTDDLGALAAYELHAQAYDLTSASAAVVRARAVEALAPKPGELIFDVGCGTGLNFSAIQQGIGPRGRLVGIDRSPAMLARAAERVARHGWRNVRFVLSAGQARLADADADGALLCLTHDVMRSPSDLARIIDRVRPGGRVVAAGCKWAPLWALPVNLATWLANLSFVSSFEGFERPWDHLARFVRGLEVIPLAEYLGAVYVARGTVTRTA